MHKVLGSILSTVYTGLGGTISALGSWRQGDQKARFDYMSPYLKKKNKITKQCQVYIKMGHQPLNLYLVQIPIMLEWLR